jgi:hypothetical protein
MATLAQSAVAALNRIQQRRDELAKEPPDWGDLYPKLQALVLETLNTAELKNLKLHASQNGNIKFDSPSTKDGKAITLRFEAGHGVRDKQQREIDLQWVLTLKPLGVVEVTQEEPGQSAATFRKERASEIDWAQVLVEFIEWAAKKDYAS